MRLILVSFISLVLLLISGCSDDVPSQSDVPPEVILSDVEQQVATSGNQFGLALFRQLAAEADSNLFIGPLSVSMALGMTLNGARGTTETAMAQTLGVGGLTADERNAAYQHLLELLTGLDPTVRFDVANSIWHRDAFDVLPSFLDVNRTHFGAEVQGLDFSDPAAAATINRWVGDATNGRIEEIVQAPIDPTTMLFLINAIYFKGDWRYPFDPEATAPGPFTRADGAAVEVPMMQMTDAAFPVLRTDAVQAINLPYGDSLFTMTVLLPGEGRTLSDLVAQMTPEQWAAWTDQLQPQTLDEIQLPRFAMRSDLKLNEVLQALGMADAFAPDQADFSGIHEQARAMKLHISKVKHKTFVEVSEEGTEAAAATSVEVGVESVQPSNTFIVDRPFVFVIREQTSGTILFVGAMYDPVA
jgi:serpin B